MSPSVLVDGWAFLPPFVINGGDYTFDGSIFHVCLDDTITFEFGLPYDSNIEWTADGVPIPGANDPLLELTSPVPTTPVNYNVCGSPSICPNYIQCLGVSLLVQFEDCNPTSIGEDLARLVEIHPNPFINGFTVDPGDLGQLRLVLYDALGGIVLDKSINRRELVDAAQWAAGMYSAVIWQDGKILYRSTLLKGSK